MGEDEDREEQVENIAPEARREFKFNTEIDSISRDERDAP